MARHLGGPHGITRLEELPATREQWIAFIESVYGGAAISAAPAASAAAPVIRRQSPRERRAARIAEAFRANPNADVKTVAAKVGLSEATVYRALKTLGAGRRGAKRRKS